METRRTDPNHDPLPIVEDDQQLYDWGIEHRLDQYYGESQAPPAHGAPAHYQSQYNQTAQTTQQPHSASPASSPCKPNTVGYVLPEHVQRAQENAAYLVTTMGSANNDQKSIKQTTVLPISPPLHGGQLLVKSENNYKRNFHKPLNIKPNGVPGRRPILPTVDMDANEVLKVRILKKVKVKKIPSPSVKIQNMGGKVCLSCEGKTLLGNVNKPFIFKIY